MEENTTPDKLRNASLKEKLDWVIEKQLYEEGEEKKKGTKSFMFPWKARVNRVKRKKGFVSICYVKDNRDVQFIKAPLDEGVIELEGVPHAVQVDDVLLYKKQPFIIQFESAKQPLSTSDYVKALNDSKQTSKGSRYIINYILKSQIKPKASIGGWIWIVVIALVVGGGYYLIKNGGLGGLGI